MELQATTSLDDRKGGDQMNKLQYSFGPLFGCGEIIVTPAALEVMRLHGIQQSELLRRHITGDWGDIDEKHKQMNNRAVQKRHRIVSAYGKGRRRILVLTWEDRSVTFILRPAEAKKEAIRQ
jgi:hypothetical protein